MKNKSWKYPFETFADREFDKDKNGELDSFETFFRDMYLDEMNQKADAYYNAENKKKKYTINDYADINTTNTNEQKQADNYTSGGVQLFVIFLVIAVLIGGSLLALSVEGSMSIRAVIIFAAVGISIFLLKSVGLYK